jgi:DNA/RNA-binding domain of Phe-tRNA-synthetase-like protein
MPGDDGVSQSFEGLVAAQRRVLGQAQNIRHFNPVVDILSYSSLSYN